MVKLDISTNKNPVMLSCAFLLHFWSCSTAQYKNNSFFTLNSCEILFGFLTALVFLSVLYCPKTRRSKNLLLLLRQKTNYLQSPLSLKYHRENWIHNDQHLTFYPQTFNSKNSSSRPFD